MARKVNYLNNKDILKEIHKSKSTFCSFVEAKYSQYDLILLSLDKINIRTVAEAKRAQAKRLQHEDFEARKLAGEKIKLAECEIDYRKIEKKDLVFRIMTFDHIPEEPGRKNKPKTVADRHAKCPYPPFIHLAWVNEGWNEVARSHWKGDLTTGEFSVTHGRITEKLASMMMMLCHRYSMRSNWRGYTYVDEMRSHALVQLSQIGLYFDESKSQNPFAYYTAAITNSFTRVLNLEKRNQNLRDDLLQQAGQTPSFTRQMDDEALQRKARESKESDYHDKMEQEMKDAGYNVL